MPRPRLSKGFIFGILFLTLLVAGIPLTLSQSQVQQILSGNAWSTTQSASAICGSSGVAIINVRFTNQETTKGIIVTAVDNQSGKSVKLGTVAAGKTTIGEINTGKTSLSNSLVTFNMAWADAPTQTFKITASYNGVSKCVVPSATPTPKPTNTPTPRPSNAPSPTITPTPKVTNTPTPKPTKTPTPTKPQPSVSPTVCLTPGTVKNVHIKCPYCTPSPSPDQ